MCPPCIGRVDVAPLTSIKFFNMRQARLVNGVWTAEPGFQNDAELMAHIGVDKLAAGTVPRLPLQFDCAFVYLFVRTLVY